MNAPTAPASFVDLLTRAVEQPGQIHAAFTAFHDYSIGNQLLAMFQCEARGIQPGPLATFPAWKARGRYVRKGEKAITLCQPVTCKRRPTDEPPDAEQPETFTRFIYRPHWFALSQTDGADYTEPPIDGWDKARALETLSITEEPFALTDGNCQGYAKDRTIAVSPIAALPEKTRFHELAHIVLGHTAEAEQTDHERTPRTLREVEAESVALLCCAALQLPGEEYSRGYIQHWNTSGEPIPERAAARIFKAADTILRAGRPDASTEQGA